MNIVVTGASRGIGFETAKEFAQAGHQVIAVARNTEKLQSLADLYDVSVYTFDLTSDNYDPLIKHIQSYGRVDVLINNAGTLLNKPFTEITDEELHYIYSVNAHAVFRLTRDLMSHFSPAAHIVNISSVGGVQGSVKFPGLTAYSSSKASVAIFTECLAEEYKATTLRFNALALGAVQTDMLKEAFPDFQAPLSAVEMAAYIVRFALYDGLYYNGKVLSISSSTP